MSNIFCLKYLFIFCLFKFSVFNVPMHYGYGDNCSLHLKNRNIHNTKFMSVVLSTHVPTYSTTLQPQS